MSVVLVVLDDELLVVVTVVVVEVGGSAHEGTPPVQLHSPALQAEMIPFLHLRFALPFKPAHRALMAPLQLFKLHGLRASTGEAEMPTPRATPRTAPSTKAANLLYCLICPLGRILRRPIAVRAWDPIPGPPSGSSACPAM